MHVHCSRQLTHCNNLACVTCSLTEEENIHRFSTWQSSEIQKWRVFWISALGKWKCCLNAFLHTKFILKWMCFLTGISWSMLLCNLYLPWSVVYKEEIIKQLNSSKSAKTWTITGYKNYLQSSLLCKLHWPSCSLRYSVYLIPRLKRENNPMTHINIHGSNINGNYSKSI